VRDAAGAQLRIESLNRVRRQTNSFLTLGDDTAGYVTLADGSSAFVVPNNDTEGFDARARVPPAGRVPGARCAAAVEAEHSEASSEPEQRTRRAATGWAQRLRRVFGIDIERCAACGGTLRIIACIEDRAVIEKILAHRRRSRLSAERAARAPCRRGRGPSPTLPTPTSTRRA